MRHVCCQLAVCCAAMAVSDMVKQGQKEIQQTDDALKRTQKIVEDTIQVISNLRSHNRQCTHSTHACPHNASGLAAQR